MRAGRTARPRALGTAAAALGAAALAVGALDGAVAPRFAWAGTPQQECEAEEFVYELYAYGVSQSLSPPSGEEVQRGQAVVLSGESDAEHPLSFELATSEAKLSSPDVDQGAGSAAGAGSTEAAERYTFKSTKASANAGTIYWQASFPVYLKHCQGGERRTYSTAGTFLGKEVKARRLEVVPEPASAPPPVEPPPTAGGEHSGTTTSWSAPSSSLRVGITAARKLRLRRRRAIAFLVDCTAACSGGASLKAWALGDPRGAGGRRLRHGRRGRGRVALRVLDHTSRISIAGAAGGHQRVTERFGGRALRALRRALKGRGQVELEVTAKVRSATGASVGTHRTILLSR